MADRRGWIRFRVVFKGDEETFQLSADAKLEEVSMLLHSTFAAAPETQKLFRRASKSSTSSEKHRTIEDLDTDSEIDTSSTKSVALKGSPKMLLLSDWHVRKLSLDEAGVHEGDTLTLLASTDADLSFVASLRDDPLLPGFEEEAARERRRHGIGMSSKKAPVAPLNGPGFADFRVLQPSQLGLPMLTPPPAEAMEFLHTLATDWGIVSVMKKYNWRVGILTEMPPEGKVGVSPRCILGFNVNRGQEISLRLRTDDLRGFRKYAVIRSTLIHELTHMVFDEHDNRFKELNSKLVKEASAMASSGPNLKAVGVSVSPSFDLGVGASPTESHSHTVGGTSLLAAADPKQAAALAAMSRIAQSSNPDAPDQSTDTMEHDGHTHDVEKPAAAPGGLMDVEGAEQPAPSENVSEEQTVDNTLPPAGFGDEVAICASCQPRSSGGIQNSAPGDAFMKEVHSEATETAAAPAEASSVHPLEPGSDSWDHSRHTKAEIPQDLAGVASAAMDLEQRLRSALDQLQRQGQGQEGTLEKATATLRKLMRNVLEHPREERYRTVRKGGRAFQASVGSFPAAVELLRIAGFREERVDEGGEAVMHCKTPDPGLLWLACSTLEQFSHNRAVAGHA